MFDVPLNIRYTYDEDIAILNYMLTNNRYLRASGIHIWKEAEKIGICPGRPYLSMKERFRKTIVKNLKDYKIDKARIMEVTEFMRANKEGMPPSP
ncbi:hypothetical protein RUM44_001676 [Polyplax serrata]|uniref:Telomeric repeat-binding factor 2-interacting protein 1 n=1 Tax=Polyplax serrata TaxID=468196 RepID=A0ABR1AKQ3_POLSC